MNTITQCLGIYKNMVPIGVNLNKTIYIYENRIIIKAVYEVKTTSFPNKNHYSFIRLCKLSHM